MDLFAPALYRHLDSWLDEDIGRGDLTGAALRNCHGSAYWVAKQAGIFCGGQLVERLFKRLDLAINVRLQVGEGKRVSVGQHILELEGPAAALVAGERTALNLAMRLSGIATATSTLVSELSGTSVRLADTRKTTPGLRTLEKYAFRCGGGINHRFGLDHAAMLKENHIAWAGGIEAAFAAVRKHAPWPSRIIVEAETPEQAEQAVRVGADGVLLDEMSYQVIQTLVPKLREIVQTGLSRGGSGQVFLEASGVDPRFIRAYASTGIDFISTSAPMTRSPWLDISMRFDNADA